VTLDTCMCCHVDITLAMYCDSCIEHKAEEYARGDDTFGCPVYDAWCGYRPYPWEGAGV
jgi:hypothetical protein